MHCFTVPNAACVFPDEGHCLITFFLVVDLEARFLAHFRLSWKPTYKHKMEIMRNVSVPVKTGNVCLISTIKAEPITREERDSQALASGRKAMDSVTETRHLLSGSPLSGGFCCCSEAGGNPRRWGRELRHWQWPVGAFWTCEWEDETVRACDFANYVSLVMVGLPPLISVNSPRWKCCLHSVGCFAFPCEKHVWVGGTWIYLFVAELVKHGAVFSFPPGRSGRWGPICFLKWTLLSVPGVWQIETVVCMAVLSTVSKCVAFWGKRL